MVYLLLLFFFFFIGYMYTYPIPKLLFCYTQSVLPLAHNLLIIYLPTENKILLSSNFIRVAVPVLCDSSVWHLTCVITWPNLVTTLRVGQPSIHSMNDQSFAGPLLFIQKRVHNLFRQRHRRNSISQSYTAALAASRDSSPVFSS